MKLLALVLTVGLIASAKCQSDSATEYVEKLWQKTCEFFVAIPGEDVTLANFNTTLKSCTNCGFRTCCEEYDVSFEKGWFWLSDVASNHQLDKTSIKTEVNEDKSTIKFNVNLKGCQIGWSAYLHLNGNITSDLNCSFDLDTIPYEFVVTKDHKTNHAEGTFKFAGMHSPRLVILASMYIPPKTKFAIMLKHAMDTNMKFRESMGDVFPSVTEQGQAHVNTALQMVDFPEHL